ncbi:hypothetical protein [Mycobacterium malmoense]|uniref:Gp37-like protein n=1 Tax=Mycobacterium malmoense TaxID=1780 RepID=UPI0008F87A06|nr:hypothetical protein [Mycobacterium malmoense]OIN79771.1 hypothetical protein BMG05_16630 [Mycobacterium malmoense]
MTTPPDPRLAALNSDDPVAASTAALQYAIEDQQVPTDIDVEICDNYYRTQGGCGDYISLKASMPRLKLPDGQIVLMGNDALAPAVLECDTTVVPVVITFSGGALTWSGRVNVAHDKLNPDGTETVECQLVGDLTILDRILVFPEPFLPIEIQPSEAIYIGPAITVFKTMVAENCMRLQLGLWELFNTLGSLDLDWRTWFGTLLMQQDLSLSDLMQMVTTPVCVIFTDPLTDTSPWIAIHGRMDTCWKLMVQQLKDNGLYPSMDLWRPGDPQPEGVAYPLQVPTLLFNLRNYSGVTGPTGTLVDGAIEDLVDFEGSLFGKLLAPFLNPGNEYVPPGSNIEIAPSLGVNYTPPWVVFNADVDDSGIVAMDVAHHHPLAYQIVLGGRSPQWLNDFLNATLEWLVDLLMIVIGVTGIPNSILDGILDNAFLAFQLFELFDLRIQLGPYAFPEKFFPTQSTYDIDALFAAVTAAYDVAGYPSAQVTFTNGQPVTLGRDLFPGAMGSLIRRGTLFSDYLDDITIIDDVNNRGKVTVQIGDGQREAPPMEIFQRKLVGLEEDVNLALLAPPNS